MTEARHTTTTLLLTAGAAFAAGYSLATVIASSPRTKSKLVSLLTFGTHTPETPRRNELSRASSSTSLNSEQPVKLAIVIRKDLDTKNLVEHVSWTVLGAFKKVYKRKDPNLNAWERSGEKLITLEVSDADDLILVQQGARAMGVPTHTFAGRDRMKKERTVMTVGPAPEDVLSQLVLPLKRLA